MKGDYLELGIPLKFDSFVSTNYCCSVMLNLIQHLLFGKTLKQVQG